MTQFCDRDRMSGSHSHVQALALRLPGGEAMSVVELAKAVHERAVRLSCGSPVVFHHVPKCGGTSVARSLRQRYLLSQATIDPAASFKAFEALNEHLGQDALMHHVEEMREQQLLYLLYLGVRCISAHVPFSKVAHRRFRQAYAFVTILRDPVERYLSHYYWDQAQPLGDDRAMPLARFVDTERGRVLGGAYVSYYAGTNPEDLSSSQAIADAKENLGRFDLVGFLDDIATFRAGLRSLLGVRISIGHENRSSTSARSRLAQSDPGVLERIEAHCAPDIEVYRHVKERAGLPTARG